MKRQAFGWICLGLLAARILAVWPDVAPAPVVTPPVDVPVVVVTPPEVVDPPVVPVVEPVAAGKRTVVIIRESADDNPEIARMIQNLRTGENAAYFTQKGHRLHFLDDEQVDDEGEPLPIVRELLAQHSEMPAIFILREDGMPLHHETLSATATDADVMRILKAWGG